MSDIKFTLSIFKIYKVDPTIAILYIQYYEAFVAARRAAEWLFAMKVLVLVDFLVDSKGNLLF